MNKQKKIFLSIIVFLTVVLTGYQVFAINDFQEEIELSENYLEYLALSDEEKQKVIVPTMYDIEKTTMEITNPFKLATMLGSSINDKFSLKTLIPQNVVVRDQGATDTCWAFASLATLESHLGLKDYQKGISSIIYDFSERHMDYATSRIFLNNEINEWGYNRTAGSTGVTEIPIAYLTNGLGAIAEEDMEFKNNTELIDISEIQNKKVITQVNDIIIFPSYSSADDLTQIKKQMKEHIIKHGAIMASVNGFGFGAYNDETAAAYANDKTLYKINHAVAIVGWDDTYSKENFLESNQPTNNGAWIIKNSYGSNFGDEGFVYISYEDVNIYKELTGIEDAQTEITYENIYQYDEFGGYLKYKLTEQSSPKMYLATEFDKKTTGKEYLTQVSITASETYTCKVYVNPNGTSKSMNDLQQVKLKAGDTETFDAGYHTIEFLEPLKINSESFVVVIEILGTQTDTISTLVEVNFGEFYTDPKYANTASHVYDNVTIADSKCFLAEEEGFLANEWDDVSKKYETSEGKVPNFDTTIKAFTTSKVLESISVETPPTKTSYVEGQDFDATGMIVKANYANGESVEITDYTIQNIENLQKGQTKVTIVYERKTVEQPIGVVENTLQKIEITTAPTKTEYWAGDNFDTNGMVVQGTYLDKTTKIITDYTVQYGENLKNGQTTVTIQYEECTIKQPITVLANSVEKLEIKQAPNKVNYVAKQNFDKTGMIVEVTYANGTIKQVTDYTVRDGNDLQEEQTTVTIVYEEQTVTQAITVVAKAVTGISIKTMPTKTEYLQNKEELDLSSGVIEISYNDNTTEEMLMTSEGIIVEGFNNKQIGKQTIMLTYQKFKTSFDITIKEEPKPESSTLNDIKLKLNGMKAYYFTDESKKEYVTIAVELTDIIKSEVNDSLEYYYYLSSSPNETHITDWVKIELLNDLGNKLGFEINSLDFANYQELSNAQNIYLYVKEVAKRNEMTIEEITTALELGIKNINIEEFIDGEKKADINSDTITDSTQGKAPDNTTAEGEIPKAGKNILIISLILIIFIVGRVAYLKYKDIEIL